MCSFFFDRTYFILLFFFFVFQFQKIDALIKNYFQHFGKIESFIMRRHQTFSNGFVQFESLLSAHKALAKSCINISKKKIVIKSADSWHQPDSKDEETKIKNENKSDKSNSTNENNDKTVNPNEHEASASSASITPPESIQFKCLYNGGLTLDQLNDDCLMEIFSKLTFYDLCIIHCAAKRFQPLTEKIFRKNYSKINLQDGDLLGIDEMTLYKLRTILMGCGQFVETLVVNTNKFPPSQGLRALDLIIRMCTNVTDVSFEQFHTGKHSNEMYAKEFFGRLECLTLIDSDLNAHLSQIIGECNNLKYLNIGSYSIFDPSSLNRNFPHLINVKIDLEDLNLSDVENFFSKNPQIKELSINGAEDIMIKIIADNLIELENLYLTLQYYADTSRICGPIANRMPNLKLLSLKCNESNVTKLIERLAKQNQIQQLYLFDVSADKRLIESLTTFTNLHTLIIKFNEGELKDQSLQLIGANLCNLIEFKVQNMPQITINGLHKFIKDANNLINLGIQECSIKLTDDFFMKLIDIYKKRGNKLILSASVSDIHVSGPLREENKSIVDLIEVTDDIDSDTSSDEWNQYSDDYYVDVDDDDYADMDDSDFDVYDLIVNSEYF